MNRLRRNQECQEELLRRLSGVVAWIAPDLKIVTEWASFAHVSGLKGTRSVQKQDIVLNDSGCSDDEARAGVEMSTRVTIEGNEEHEQNANANGKEQHVNEVEGRVCGAAVTKHVRKMNLKRKESPRRKQLPKVNSPSKSQYSQEGARVRDSCNTTPTVLNRTLLKMHDFDHPVVTPPQSGSKRSTVKVI